MGWFSNRIDRQNLKPGDHIYTWRTAYIYAHHGIYVGDDTVIHFTRHGQEVGTGTVLDSLLIKKGPARSYVPCSTCDITGGDNGVISTCLNCFLAGGVLCLFEYGVSSAHFLAQPRGGTCTFAPSDPDEEVVHRAKHLLENGFGGYNLFKSNCEHFANYCKTGLLVVNRGTIGQSGQAESIIRGHLVAMVQTAELRLAATNIFGMAATYVGLYCANRYASDVGITKNVVKVRVEELTQGLATGLLQLAEPQVPATHQ
ncbi:hypothetical protein SLE2022_125240 [Rubroshorea leprosula]